MSYKNRKALLAENAKLKAAAARAQNKGTKKVVFPNMIGHPCEAEFTMNSSNKAIKRHLSDDCGCFVGAGKKGRTVSYTCKVVKWDVGFTQGNAGIGVKSARRAGLIL